MVLTVEVAGEEYRATSNYNISQQAGGVSNSSVDIRVESGQTVPQSLSAVQIFVDAVPFFFGIIQSIDSPAFSSGEEVKLYRLNLSSGEILLKNRLVSEAYEGKYTHEIIQDLFTNYIADEGITLGEISETAQYYENYNVANCELGQCIDELADDVNASFYVSADKKFYFLTKDAFTEVTVPTHIKNLQIQEEAGDLRTTQIITGAKEATSSQTEQVVWVADQTVFALGYPIKSITSVKINTVACNVGILGIDEDDTTKTFLYNVGTQQLVLNSTATTKPAATDTVECVYIGYYDVIITSSNEAARLQIAALNGSSGIIENLYDDETLVDLADAQNKALSLLDLYGERERVVSCDCHDLDASELLNMWTFAEPDLNIEGQYVVTERTITGFTETEFMLRVVFNNKNFARRYGTVLNPRKKTVGKETKIDKSSALFETISVIDTLSIENSGLPFYPTNGAFTDPGMADSFYPMGA